MGERGGRGGRGEGEWEEEVQCDVTGRVLGYGDWYTKVGAQRDLCGAEWRELPAHERRRYARIDGPGDLDRADAMTAAELGATPDDAEAAGAGDETEGRWAEAVGASKDSRVRASAGER